jgi:hypothetical protein
VPELEAHMRVRMEKKRRSRAQVARVRAGSRTQDRGGGCRTARAGPRTRMQDRACRTSRACARAGPRVPDRARAGRACVSRTARADSRARRTARARRTTSAPRAQDRACAQDAHARPSCCLLQCKEFLRLPLSGNPLHLRTDFHNTLRVYHEESRAHIHARDIPRTQFQSRLETQKIEAVVMSSKPRQFKCAI